MSLQNSKKNILKHAAFQNPYYIKNSFDFKEKIKNVKIPDDFLFL